MNTVGMTESLVDNGGYPRQDLDVYQVRHARHKIIFPVKKYTDPIAKVNFVASNSPAEEAGICVDDLIVEFGSVNSSNFKSLNNIADIVQNSQGRPINVQVKRNNAMVRMNLTPHVWAGRGLLGCNIIPVELVER
ncbi:26S proteasome non-ATPase regulatory subunit 9 [Blattella germanica]|nr:26S proteasome non-ATPase regulatory subunit 9 [Blattella germanica]